MAVSWNSNYLIFPFQIIEGLGAGTEWKTDHVTSIGAEVFNSRWDNSRWRFSLSEAKVLSTEMDTWDAFVEAVRGAYEPFLFRANSRRFEIRDEVLTAIPGDGNKFQLRKSRTIQGKTSSEIIKYPWHNYPDIKMITGQVALPSESVRVTVNNVLKTEGTDYTIDRDTGIIAFGSTPSGTIRASCKFMKLVHGVDLNVLDYGGGDSWAFSGSAELIGVFDE